MRFDFVDIDGQHIALHHIVKISENIKIDDKNKSKITLSNGEVIDTKITNEQIFLKIYSHNRRIS